MKKNSNSKKMAIVTKKVNFLNCYLNMFLIVNSNSNHYSQLLEDIPEEKEVLMLKTLI